MSGLEPVESYIAEKNAMLEGDGLVNFFDFLGVPEDASTDLIQQQYFQAVKLIHPDRLDQLGGQELKPKAARLFQDFTEAYDVLRGIKSRLEHLRAIKAHRDGRPNAPSEDQARIFANRGSSMMARRDFAQAESFFRNSLDRLSVDLEVQLDLAWAIFHNPSREEPERIKLVRDSLDEILRARPGHSRALYYMAMVYKVEGDYRREARYLTQCLSVDPNYRDALREQRLLAMRLEKSRKGAGGLLKKIKRMLKKRR
jgi:tetratricopeptide (TPR) repeat protein